MASESEKWTKEAVLKQLQERAGSGTACAQIFLHGDAGESLPETVHKIVGEAAASAGEGSAPLSVGRISKLAKSFSLTANHAVFEALARDPKVKSILPTEIDDIYSKPVKRGSN